MTARPVSKKRKQSAVTLIGFRNIILVIVFILFSITLALFFTNPDVLYDLRNRAATTLQPAPPPPYFGLLPKGSTLPSEAECAAKVRRSLWEPKSPYTTYAINTDNTSYNTNSPTAIQLQQYYDGAPAELTGLSSTDYSKSLELRKRVTGNFTGTTDELIQWAACKWGFDEERVRAIAVQETNWYQRAGGDFFTNITADCPPNPVWRDGKCAQSYGITQVKWKFRKSAWPMSWDSTAFNLDLKLSEQRACFEGYTTWLRYKTSLAGYPSYPNGTTDQMEWGCIGQWFSGGWYDSGAVDYINKVKNYTSTKPWLSWPAVAFATSTTPTPTTTPITPTQPTSPGAFTISTPLSLDKTLVTNGDTVNATVTYTNTSSSEISIQDIVIAARPPGGTNSGGPYLDFSPHYGATTVAPGQTIMFTTSRTFTSSDPVGQWYSYATYKDATGAWRDGPPFYFTFNNTVPSPTSSVQAVPTIQITSPTNGSVISTRRITISTSVSDPTKVKQVNFYIDGALKMTDFSTPYTFVWDTRKLSSGTHTIKAVVSDTSGNSSNDQITVVK